MFRTRAFRITLIAVASFACLACASTQTQTISASSTRPGAELVVRNSSTKDVNIYVLSGANRVRLGTARALGTSRLTLPAMYLSNANGVLIHADAIGASVSHTFPAMHLAASNRVELQIGNVLAMSTFGIW
jgi:hypothetical protein